MDIAAMREGLKANLATVPDLHPYAYMPDSPLLPAAIVTVPDGDFISPNQAFQKGLAQVRFVVQVLVQFVDAQAAQAEMDAYVSGGTAHDRSLIDAIESDKQLGGAASDLRVDGVSNYGHTVLPGEVRVGAAEIAVTVYKPRT